MIKHAESMHAEVICIINSTIDIMVDSKAQIINRVTLSLIPKIQYMKTTSSKVFIKVISCIKCESGKCTAMCIT